MRISIITVCYNSATVIRSAIESVLSQTHADIEYLIIDGGSRDETVPIIREYAARAAGRITWLSERDAGMYDALNKGIRLATGEVVGIVNADDVLHDDQVVEKVARAFGGSGSESPPDIIYGDIRFVGRQWPDRYDAVRCAPTVRYYAAWHWRPWMASWGVMPPHPSVYIRRELFEKYGYYPDSYQIAADFALMVRLLRKERLRLKYLPMCFVDMRMGGKSTKNWRSNLLLNRENVRANRAQGYFCVLPMMMPKYVFKIWEYVIPRVRTAFRSGTRCL